MRVPSFYEEGGHDVTAINIFEHPETSASVSLVGVVHAGSPGYYAALKSYISDRESQGSKVHVENCAMPSRKTRANYPAWAWTAAEQFNSADEEQSKALVEPGHVDQNHDNGLGWPDHWESHDLNCVEVMIHLGRLRSKIMISLARHQGTTNRIAVAASNIAYILCDPVEIRRRNQVAIAAIDSAHRIDPDQDLTLVWGAEHVKGIGKALLKRSFNLTQTLWFNSNQPLSEPAH